MTENRQIYRALGLKEYCQNEYTTQGNLDSMQSLPYQITNTIFHRTRTKKFLICMEIQKTQRSQSNIEKENQNSNDQAPCCWNILQSYSNQNGLKMPQKQKYRSVARMESPEVNPCTDGQLTYEKGGKNIKWGKRQSLQEFLSWLSS